MKENQAARLRSPLSVPQKSCKKYGGECKQNAFNIKGLQEPYQIGEVRRFGEKLPERENFKLAAAHHSAEVRWRMPANMWNFIAAGTHQRDFAKMEWRRDWDSNSAYGGRFAGLFSRHRPAKSFLARWLRPLMRPWHAYLPDHFQYCAERPSICGAPVEEAKSMASPVCCSADLERRRPSCA